jgi:hypothetical protein
MPRDVRFVLLLAWAALALGLMAPPLLAAGATNAGGGNPDVERPAEQYRGRYQLRLSEADSLIAAASRITWRTPNPRRSPSQPAEAAHDFPLAA